MSATEAFARTTLRFRRFGGGYRREDVERVLAELRLTVHALELELPSLRERSRELENRLRESTAEPARAPSPPDGLARAVAERRRRELEELARSRDEALQSLRGIVSGLEEVLARAAAEVPVVHTPAPPDTPAPQAGADLVASQVELDAGPFADLDAVLAFERSLAGIPRVEDVHVRRLLGQRATIDLTLSESTSLLRRLREHLPYLLELRGTGEGRLLLDVAPARASGPG